MKRSAVEVFEPPIQVFGGVPGSADDSDHCSTVPRN